MPRNPTDPKDQHSEPLLLRVKPAAHERLKARAAADEIPLAVLGRACLLRGLEELEREHKAEKAA